MGKNVSLYAIVLVCALLSSCGSIGGKDHEVESSTLEPDVLACERHAVSYRDARDNFCIGLKDNNHFEEHERQLLSVLARLYEGDDDSAMNEFAHLVEQGHKGEFQSQLVSSLSALYLNSYRWGDLHDLLSEHGHEVLGDAELELEAMMAETFRELPPEEIWFDSEPAEVHTSINRFGQPVLRVLVHGVKKSFVLDTGAGMTVLTRSTAKKLGVRTWDERTAEAQTSTRNSVDLWPGMIDELQLGSLRIRNHPIGVVEDHALEFKLAGIRILKIDGIIGWPLFRQLRIEIGYDGGNTTIRRSVKQSIPRRNLFWLGYPFVVACGDDEEPYFFGLDTGAAGTSLNTHVVTKAGLSIVSGGQGIRLGAGGSETVNKRNVRGFSMHLSGRRYLFPDISISDGVKNAELIKPDGRLGSDVLRKARVVVDLPNGYFAIQR